MLAVRMSRAAFLRATLGMSMAADPPGRWSEARVRAVAPGAERHSMHTYFNLSPESPDGRWVLFYTSTTADGHHGEIRIRERATGKERMLAEGIYTEDAHRAACQQWVSGGRRVAFHNEVDGEWRVMVADAAGGEPRVVARNQMLSWGRPGSDEVPVYRPHWVLAEDPDIDLLDVRTGARRKAVTARATRERYGKEIAARFGERPVSLFFPIVSPDGQRLVFKLAAPMGGDPRSVAASDRECLVGYDLAAERFLFFREKWGHPAWHPGSRTLINVYNVLIDTDTGVSRPIEGLPKFPGSHPSVSPDGRMFATDTMLESFGGKAGEWGVVVGDLRGEWYRILERFDNRGGARSWRRSHPHPVFSPDGKRVYFNVSRGRWTELFVAE